MMLQVHVFLRPKSNHRRLVQQHCHPECNEGSRREILRYAQNDRHERPQRKVYEVPRVRFSESIPKFFRISPDTFPAVIGGFHPCLAILLVSCCNGVELTSCVFN